MAPKPTLPVFFWSEDQFLTEAGDELGEHVCGDAEGLAKDRERGSLTDVWGCDPDYLRLQGRRRSFVMYEWAANGRPQLHVIGIDEFTNAEQQVLRAFFQDPETGLIGEDFTGGWEAFDAMESAIAYRGGRGYGYQLIEVHPQFLEYYPTRDEVEALRKATGHGMMDCKKALTETGGKVEEAKELLRKATRHRL